MKILEQSIIGKHGLEKCEDRIVFTPDFVAVIDGSTSKSLLSPLPNGKSGGQMAAEIVAEVIQTMPPTTDLRSFVKNTNLLFQKSYARYYAPSTIKEMNGLKQNRWTCSLIIYSRHENSIWMIGDCMGLLLSQSGCQTELSNEKPYEQVLAERRAKFLQEQLNLGNTTVAEVRKHDIGRDMIIPIMLEEMKNQNVTYAVIDGFDVAWQGVKVISNIHCKEIVLASDGYLKLFPTLHQTENYLQEYLAKDPLMIQSHVATKAWMEGTDSFDDRTYIRFEK